MIFGIFGFFKGKKEKEPEPEKEKDGTQILVEMANKINPNLYEETKAINLACEDEDGKIEWIKFYINEDED